jgi:hypothetical protein
MKIEPAKGTRTFDFRRSRYEHLKNFNVLRSLVVAKSGSGKTVLLQQMILKIFRDPQGHSIFERVYIFSPTALTDTVWEPVLKFCRKELKHPEDEPGPLFDEWREDVIQKIVDDQKLLIEYEKSHPKEFHNKLHQILIIIDDWASDESIMRGKRGQILKELYLRGRHFGINLIVSVQKWKLASTVMRTQATSVFYFRAGSLTDLDDFLENFSALVPGGKKALMQIYREATKEPWSFLTVDLLQQDPNRIFMKRFDSYLTVG